MREFVQVFDHALPAHACDTLIGAFHDSEQQRIERGTVPHCAGSSWDQVQLHGRRSDELCRDAVRFLDLYNHMLGAPPAPQPEAFELPRVKRYRVGGTDQFETHYDVRTRESLGRYLVCLWYLNDVAEGGETAFPALRMSVQARRGRLVMFPPYWLFPHAGRAPLSGDKYVAMLYLRMGGT